MGDHRDPPRNATQILNHYFAEILRVDDQLIGATPGKHLDPQRGLLRKAVARVGFEVVNCKNERIPTQQGQRQVKPKVGALIVDHIWCKIVNPLTNAANSPELLYGVPEPRTLERKKAHLVAELGGVRLGQAVRKCQ